MTRAEKLARAVRSGEALVADLRSLGYETPAAVVDGIVGALQTVRVHEAVAALADPGDMAEQP